MKCILVTGGAGFIGSHTTLCLLENGFDVIVVDSLFNSYEESINRVRKIYKSKNKFSRNNLFFFKVDLCNLNKFEYVFKKAISLINDNVIDKKNICFYLGYTGWSSSQLEYEIKNNLWIIKDNSFRSKIIKKRKKSLWKDFMISLGGDYLIWANSPDNPYLN